MGEISGGPCSRERFLQVGMVSGVEQGPCSGLVVVECLQQLWRAHKPAMSLCATQKLIQNPLC